MEIWPVDRKWIYDFMVEPYLQGCELVNEAWKGVDHSLVKNPLSLIDRGIRWLQGTALMIPLLNAIIWMAWQTFGHPEKFVDPFCPEIDFPPPEIIPEIIHRPKSPKKIAEDGKFTFHETIGQETHPITWEVKTIENSIIATQKSEIFSTSAKYNSDYQLQTFHYEKGSDKTDLSINDRSEVTVKIEKEDEKTLQTVLSIPPDGLPWIQQRWLGLKPFVLSKEKKIEFYAVVPEYPKLISWFPSFVLKPAPFVMKAKAIKMGKETISDFGRLLKVEISSTLGPYNAVKSELWFDPKTGDLKKFVDSGTFISTKTGELVQNNLLPESKHQ